VVAFEDHHENSLLGQVLGKPKGGLLSLRGVGGVEVLGIS